MLWEVRGVGGGTEKSIQNKPTTTLLCQYKFWPLPHNMGRAGTSEQKFLQGPVSFPLNFLHHERASLSENFELVLRHERTKC